MGEEIVDLQEFSGRWNRSQTVIIFDHSEELVSQVNFDMARNCVFDSGFSLITGRPIRILE
jgi:hypothetical protein